MKSAPLPPDEDARLSTLHRYDILDTEQESSFDALTELAAKLCDVPIALISLVDKDRQWFKSKVGIDAAETPRDLAFCAHAILEPDHVFEVSDAREDERFADNPFVTGPMGIRFYAGSPLKTYGGEVLGTLCVIDQTPRALSLEQHKMLCVLAHQVVSQIELRQALRRSREKTAELQQFRQQGESLVRKLTDSNTELEHFAYAASHDMQEPLRMIGNFTQLIEREYGDRFDAEGREYIHIVTDSVKRIQGMIDDLLNYARLAPEPVRKKPFDSDVELTHVLMDLSDQVRDASAIISRDTRFPHITGSPVQFMRLMQHLVSNALKYRDKSRTPEIHIGVTASEGEWRFSVSDNGIGMDQTYLDDIFEPFKRLHIWKEYTGSGMGLAVCKKIVENHGGKIIATSQPGRGSTFYFTWPKH